MRKRIRVSKPGKQKILIEEHEPLSPEKDVDAPVEEEVTGSPETTAGPARGKKKAPRK